MNKRPYVLSIAGFDPSSGAGVTSDIKTFEQHKVYGLGVVTAITYQNETEFCGLRYLPFEEVEAQLNSLAEKYAPLAIKIGLIESAQILINVLDWIKRNWPEAFIIWDPIIKASAGFSFHTNLHREVRDIIRGKVNLLTPNLPEYNLLFSKEDPQEIVESLSACILIKGGHMLGNEVSDELYLPNDKSFQIKSQKIKGDLQKHGTGCILSSAIAAEIAKGNSIQSACSKAHFYVKKIIGSNPSLLGYHHTV